LRFTEVKVGNEDVSDSPFGTILAKNILCGRITQADLEGKEIVNCKPRPLKGQIVTVQKYAVGPDGWAFEIGELDVVVLM